MISTKNVPVDQLADLKKANARVKGVDSKPIVLSIPLGVPNMKEAIDKAIESHPNAVALCDGVIYSKGWHCIFYGQNKYVVEGTPIYADRSSTNSYNQQVQPMQQNNYQASQTAAVQLFHEVQAGETIASIAQAYNVSIRDILSWNKLSSNVLNAGMRLVIYLQ